VHDETLVRKKLRRVGINIDREPKEDFGLRGFFEKTAPAKEGGDRENVCVNQGLAAQQQHHVTNR
jgi:hypothetical protein